MMQWDQELELYLKKVNQWLAEAGHIQHLYPPAVRAPQLPLAGKQVRARLLYHAATALGQPPDRLPVLGAAIEMIHNASLFHDDVIDGAQTRRGEVCLHVENGPQMAIMIGDICFTRAMELICRQDNLEVYRAVSREVVNLASGQLADSVPLDGEDASLERYFFVVERKTGSLFALCLELPAILAGLDATARQNLREAGLLIGRLFQVADDMLDFSLDPAATGKDAFRDLREGKHTYPYLQLLRLGTPEQGDYLRACLTTRQFDSSRLLAIIRETNLPAIVAEHQLAWMNDIEARLAAVKNWQDGGVLRSLLEQLAFRRQ